MVRCFFRVLDAQLFYYFIGLAILANIVILCLDHHQI